MNYSIKSRIVAALLVGLYLLQRSGMQQSRLFPLLNKLRWNLNTNVDVAHIPLIQTTDGSVDGTGAAESVVLP